MQNSKTLFFETLRAALDRKDGFLSKEKMFHQKVWYTADCTEDPDILRKNQADWMASFIEQAIPLSIETMVVDTPDGLAKAIADIAVRTPTEWFPVKTVVCCNHPLIPLTAIQQALDAHSIPMYFPGQGSTSTVCGGTSTEDSVQDAPRQLPADSERRMVPTDLRMDFRQKCAEATLGIFTADAAIAESATLVLRTTPDCPRIVSLLPSASIAIVPFGCIFDTFSRLSAHLARNPAPDGMTFITGPSKTADIEAVMVPGAHGPRSLYVLFVTNEGFAKVAIHCPLFS